MFEVDTFSRQAIGFDRLFDVMNNIRGTDTNYPPYDIIKEDEETFVIEFALSGFKKDDLNELIIKVFTSSIERFRAVWQSIKFLLTYIGRETN